jgi:hypothetical protein
MAAPTVDYESGLWKLLGSLMDLLRRYADDRSARLAIGLCRASDGVIVDTPPCEDLIRMVKSLKSRDAR